MDWLFPRQWTAHLQRWATDCSVVIWPWSCPHVTLMWCGHALMWPSCDVFMPSCDPHVMCSCPHVMWPCDPHVLWSYPHVTLMWCGHVTLMWPSCIHSCDVAMHSSWKSYWRDSSIAGKGKGAQGGCGPLEPGSHNPQKPSFWWMSCGWGTSYDQICPGITVKKGTKGNSKLSKLLHSHVDLVPLQLHIPSLLTTKLLRVAAAHMHICVQARRSCEYSPAPCCIHAPSPCYALSLQCRPMQIPWQFRKPSLITMATDAMLLLGELQGA